MAMQSSEAELMRECAPLYGSIAIEALAAVVMGCTFLYLWLKISTKNSLKTPTKAVFRLMQYSFKTSWKELTDEMRKWPTMPTTTLMERFTFCRKCNQAILLFQAFT